MFHCDACGSKLEFHVGTSIHNGYHYCPKCAGDKCQCDPYSGWDKNCCIPLHRQIFDRPGGMTD